MQNSRKRNNKILKRAKTNCRRKLAENKHRKPPGAHSDTHHHESPVCGEVTPAGRFGKQKTMRVTKVVLFQQKIIKSQLLLREMIRLISRQKRDAYGQRKTINQFAHQ